MCRNIDFMAADAFYNGKKWQLSNTRTEGGEMWLHGVNLKQIKGEPYLNGVKISDSEWIRV